MFQLVRWVRLRRIVLRENRAEQVLSRFAYPETSKRKRRLVVTVVIRVIFLPLMFILLCFITATLEA